MRGLVLSSGSRWRGRGPGWKGLMFMFNEVVADSVNIPSLRSGFPTCLDTIAS